MVKQDVYQDVTDRIVTALEQGTVPWHKPWTTSLPVSIRNGKAYRGVNVLLLGLAGRADPRWGTFKAIREAGGSVRKGEKGTHIILWKPVVKRAAADGAEPESYMLLKSYVVFNAEQAHGLPALELDELREHESDERADAIVSGYESGPVVIHGSDRALYSPGQDLVRMPDPERFESSDAYYLTLLHELVHSTGHESRLNRLEPALFGTDPYAREELVAELGASMLAGLAGLEGAAGEQSAAYVAGWLRKLKDDRKLVVQAAAAAQRAADRIVGETFSGELVEDERQELEPVAA
jgi:antirestriction protein ArdC